MKIKKKWLAIPISRKCGHFEKPSRQCGKQTVAAYPIRGKWLALCENHAREHLPIGAMRTAHLIAMGAKWE